MADVVAELSFDPPLDPQGLAAMRECTARRCVAADRVRLERAFLAASGNIVVCHFTAPDAESVRIALRRAGIEYVRVWTAGVF